MKKFDKHIIYKMNLRVEEGVGATYSTTRHSSRCAKSG